MRVLLIAGGWSSEREVSLSGAKGIRKALKALGHEPVDFDPASDFAGLFKVAKTVDAAFINLHGAPGEDGLIQAMLDSIGLPYQGTGPAGSFLALNKAASKAVFTRHGLPSPQWEFLTHRPEPGWRSQLNYPIFAKPNLGGSSLGMSLVNSSPELGAALDIIFDMGEEALLETFIPGCEITCGILGETALPPILIKPKGDAVFFDYSSKYTAGNAEEICPAPISNELTRHIQDITLKAHKALGLYGYSRADFIVDRDDNPWLLEVNTLPGMTPTSLLPQEAAANGINFPELIQQLLDLGLERNT